MVFHVLNRGNDRREIFDDRADYEAFLRVMKETQERVPMRVLAYCLLPNHWHFLLWPVNDGDLGAFMQRLTTTHVRRCLRARLAKTAEEWPYNSLAQRARREGVDEAPELSTWPVVRPRNWSAWVDRPQTKAELEAVRLAVSRGQPFGDEAWQRRTAERLGLEFTLNPRRRPRKASA